MRYILSIAVLSTACESDTTTKTFNDNPEITIMSHSDGFEALEGEVISFRAQASDTNDNIEDLLVAWYLGPDVICDWATPTEGGESYCDITIGGSDSSIIAEVQDPVGAAGRSEVAVIVTPNEAPTAQILSPVATDQFYSDQLISFHAFAADLEDNPEDLLVQWESSVDGELVVASVVDSNGDAEGAGYLSEGEHFLQLHVTDSGGKSVTESMVLTVGGPNSVPSCAITSPADESGFSVGETIIFRGIASDADVASSALTFDWNSDKDGALGTGSINSDGELSFPYGGLSANTHTISLNVTDEIGEPCSDTIIISVGTAPVVNLVSPQSGELYQSGESIAFVATIADNDEVPSQLNLSWESSIDGVFSTQPSDSNGNVSFSNSSLSAGSHNLSVTATDSSGLTTAISVTVMVNTPPTAPTVVLLPAAPTTSNNLLVSASGSSDADGHNISYDYEWYLNGALTANTSAAISSADTNKGEIWTARVIPNDGYHQGQYAEASVVIENSAPAFSSVSISPGTPNTTDLVTCAAAATDADGETLTETYSWTNVTTGAQLGLGTTLQLTENNSANGDVVRCDVEVADSDTSVTGSATVTVVFVNRAPDTPVLSITPNPANSASTLTCTLVSATDPDGDPVTAAYSWYVNSILQPLQTQPTYGGSLSSGDTVVCTVVTSDGQLSSPMGSASITITNSAPVIDSLSVGPNPATTNDSLTATVVASDPDGDPVTLSYEWSVNGIVVQSSTLNTLASSFFTRGNVVSVSVTPSDANSTGASAVDGLTISNTAPTGGSVSISPLAPTQNVDDLVCTASGATDDDGDSISYSFSWTVDGLPFNGASASGNSSIVSAINTFAGELWTCEATPSDGNLNGPAVSISVTIGAVWNGTATFTACGQTGRTGPSQLMCDSEYSGGSLENQVTVVNGYQYWVVPSTGTYRIEVFGAQGGDNAGYGARMQGEFQLSSGTQLKILVGQEGIKAPPSSNQPGNYTGSGGGGGTFVADSNDTPYIIAGGGGGTGHDGAYRNNSNLQGSTSTNGQDGNGGNFGPGGSGGQGGSASTTTGNGTANGAGGGGFYGDGQSSSAVNGGANGGLSFVNGGIGGDSTGGFGGGGGSNLFIYGCGNSPHGGSGGGGYSGGGSGGTNCNGGGGGGGSYNNGSNQSNSGGANSGPGYVIIELL